MLYVLDASALLNNELFSFAPGNRYFTTPKVFAEWRDFRSKSLAENALAVKSLALREPQPVSVRIALEAAAKSGTKLQDPDLSVIALAIELRGNGENPVVVTDDYSVQNVLALLGITFEGIAQKGIRSHRNFRPGKK